jgi:hypothetical protein
MANLLRGLISTVISFGTSTILHQSGGGGGGPPPPTHVGEINMGVANQSGLNLVMGYM